MKILVLGDDPRNDYLIDYYQNAGHTVIHESNTVKNIDTETFDVIVFPVAGVANNFKIGNMDIPADFLSSSKKNAAIFSGIETNALKKLLQSSKRKCTYIMQDATVQRENAIPTTEGIIADLVSNTDITVNDSKVMVIGYGNIGKYLVNILKEMGAHVVVAVEKQADVEYLDRIGISAFFTSHPEMIAQLKTVDTIVNTAPSLVLKEEHIPYLKKNVYILDVASAPYGVDMNALQGSGIPYKIYTGIPSKVAPKTAGKILTKKINSIIGGLYE